MSADSPRYLLPLGLLLFTLAAAACGSSTGDAATSSTTTLQTTPSTTMPVVTTSSSTTTLLEPLDETCEDGGVGTTATVVGVVEYVRIREEPTTASDEIGQLSLGSTVAVYTDQLTYDGSEYWWVPVRVPAAGTCGSVAAEFLADDSGRLDQQIPGISFRPPTSGEWTFTDRTSLRDPVEGSLDGSFFTTFSVTVTDGTLIDQLLADQLAEFEEFEYDYPADWNIELSVAGADRAVRLIPISSPSGDLVIDRLLIEVFATTVEATTSVYVEDFDRAPLDELDAFLDSVAIDRDIFLAAAGG
ncbi:MAG: SH3 domain-containing protein [Acidimicrobiia bacterium]|nr:SH3 domain-containing protein [Acidimicrobiia bacterium]